MLPCPIKALTGFDCLGCGFQRSVLNLLHLEFDKYFQQYPPLIIGLAITVIYYVLKKLLHIRLAQYHLLIPLITLIIVSYLVKF
jgi:hypothetical protein